MYVLQKAIVDEHVIRIPTGRTSLDATLTVPEKLRGIVVVAAGTQGRSRHAPRTRYLADAIRHAGFATLVVDLITEAEQRGDYAGTLRFDVRMLETRLVAVLRWAAEESGLTPTRIGACVSGAIAAAAMQASVRHPDLLKVVVSFAGRLELVHASMPAVRAPTLLIVGGEDSPVLQGNQYALAWLGGPRHLEVIMGAGHYFDGPGEMERAAQVTGAWFDRHL